MLETRLQTRLFSVERRTYTDRTGRSLQRDIIVHPGAVVIIPRIDVDRIVMIRNERFAAGQVLLELPAGTLEPPEEPIQTAARELEEETGYRAGHLEPFIEFFTTPGICTELMRCFVATELTAVPQRLEPDENISVELMEMSKLRSALTDGSIRDGKTLASLGAYFTRGEWTVKQGT